MQAQLPLLKITRHRGQNQYYEEPLGEGLPLRMMLIPAGRFTMGSPKDEPERTEAEGPQHEVAISQFFMGQYPVTQSQWRFVAALPQVNRELDPDPSHFKGDNRPVERVSWHEAVEFCARLTIHTDRLYRLPTEAEWEYACRAETTTPFHFGVTISTDYANYNGSNEQHGAYGPGSRGIRRGETTPVDEFKVANKYGLHDMHGNVYEWCQDYWHENYVGAPTDGSAWTEGGDSSRRIIRGGSWLNDPWYCRSAYRARNAAGDRNDDIGFRVCCSAPRTG
ncbi:MAG: formylglycine-generating enzyme family protein [Synechococcales bacterium]|nr:formylglycine-generating enzyme family protein [Synechococcales bacterium]